MKTLPKVFFCIILLLYLIFSSLSRAAWAASPGDVVINEVMWMGSSLGVGDEWLEFYNAKGQEVDIGDWQLTKKSGGTEVLMLEIPAGEKIPAYGFYLISEYDEAHSKIQAAPDLVNGGEDKDESNFALANDKLQIKLYDGVWNAGATLVDTADDGIGSPAAGDKNNFYSMERNNPPGDGTLASSWHTAQTSVGFDSGAVEKGTPQSVNSTPPTPTPSPTPTPIPTPTVTLTPTPTITPTPTSTSTYSSSIFLNEFLPDPLTGENEWVELYNASDQSVDLSDWQVDDIEGGSSPQTIESGTVIGPKGYLVIYFSSAKLNNSGDSVRLLDPAGVVHDEFSYKNSTKGWSWAKKSDGSWQETSIPTPGQVNQFNQEEEEEEDEDSNATDSSNLSYLSYSIFNARQQKLGSYLSVEGIISAPPEVLGVKVMFIQQDETGIKIKLADLDYSQLNLGDKVRVEGELKESFQEKYLKDSGQTVTFLAKGTLPEPHKVKTGEINEDLEGRLVVVNAEVVETSGSTFYLDDGSGRIKIYIKSTTEIEKPKMRKGYFAKVVGIVSQYKENYRVLPRFQEDLLVSDQPIGDEVKFEGESWVDPPETDELLTADGEVLGTVTELPATGVDMTTTLNLFLVFGLFLLNLFALRLPIK